MLDYYLKSWNLERDGETLITHSSQLLPVIYEQSRAMLKIAISEEERLGAKLMVWWKGMGVAPVLRHDDRALLMERAVDNDSLVQKVQCGLDDESSEIICAVAARLHGKKENPPELLPLKIWFRGLDTAALKRGGIFQKAQAMAHELLSSQQDIAVLHGDLHHGNILNFGEKGWLAIDPKNVYGERGYDFANLFCNPSSEIALTPGRFQKQLQIVADAASLDRARLLKWIFAYCGLSAAWSIEDGESPQLALDIAEIAVRELSTGTGS